jgi:hypothetical protein
VIRELEKIFGLDPVARELRVACHALVFLEQLRGIAPLTIVLAVPRLTADVLPSLSPTTAPATALTIVDQMPTSLRSVSVPFASGGAAQRRYGAALTLSFRSARGARSERPIVSGWDRMRSQPFVVERPGPGP